MTINENIEEEDYLNTKEIIEQEQHLNSLKNLYENEKSELRNQLDRSNTQKKNLTKKNNELILENKRLQSNYDENNTIMQQQCAETLREEKNKNEEFKQSIKSMSGGFRNQLNKLENKICGGIIGQIKKKLKTSYNKEYSNLQNLYKNNAFSNNSNNLNNLNNLNGGKKQTGGNPIVFMVLAVAKIIFITIGTFIFDWWPIMMLLSLYCVFIEYKMIKLSGQPIMGMPIAFLLGAYLCPCIWVIVRLVMGFTTSVGLKANLFNVFSKCTDDGFTVNFHEYYGKGCNDNKCIWTTTTCHNALFGANVDNNTDNNTDNNITNNVTNMFKGLF